jgi:hypothetical protein
MHIRRIAEGRRNMAMVVRLADDERNDEFGELLVVSPDEAAAAIAAVVRALADAKQDRRSALAARARA